MPYGKAKVVRPGSDVTVLTYLTGVASACRPRKRWPRRASSAEVIDLRTLDYTGMDYATIGESVRKTGSVLIVEQAPRSLTLGGRISDEIQERFFDYLDCPVGKVTGAGRPAARLQGSWKRRPSRPSPRSPSRSAAAPPTRSSRIPRAA